MGLPAGSRATRRNPFIPQKFRRFCAGAREECAFSPKAGLRQPPAHAFCRATTSLRYSHGKEDHRTTRPTHQGGAAPRPHRQTRAQAARSAKPARAAKTAKTAAKTAAKAAPRKGKWVYTFGDGKAEGRAEMRNLLGGKGANLAEMANLGLPVPPGFTITTEVCT